LLALVGVTVALAALLWLPLVRSITRPLAEASRAAEEIALGRFDVRLDEHRADEIGALGASINAMATRLGDYVRGQKRFLGDVAHELASPLARIQLGLAVLEQRVDAAAQERVREVAEEAREMSRLVEELLQFTRAELRDAKSALGVVKLAPIVQRAIDRERADGVTIRSEVGDDLEAVGDTELLTRALANVLRNAVRYAGQAGPVVVTARRDGTQVEIEVRDGGPGVPPETLDRLFEPFYRPQAARERETGGVGLGLAIVKACVAACGGTVRARNLSPNGFLVAISLPRS
jgi:two-component system sensor histidine kinase CpxA